MRNINQIIIVIIFIILVFIIKNDYKLIYSKTLSYIEQGIGKSIGLQEKADQFFKSINTVSTINDGKESLTAIETPGALIVLDDYITYNTKNINLTKKGVINITNRYRSENGNLIQLTENSKLNFSAEKKLQDMFVKQYFEHVSPEGISVGELGDQSGYEYIIIGENLALGNFKDDQALVDAWMASPGHRANILNKRYTEIGVSVARGSYKDKNVWMAVQHFGLPKSACPSIDSVLRGIIDLEQQRIKQTEEDLASKRVKIDSGAIFEGMTTNGQIEQYNSLVSDYNKLILSIKEKINKYNKEVRDFNNCISETD